MHITPSVSRGVWCTRRYVAATANLGSGDRLDFGKHGGWRRDHLGAEHLQLLLFVISGFSTGAAWLLLLSMLSSNPGAQAISAKLEQLDAMLIVTELIILGAYFNFAMFLPTGARASAEFLFHSPVFIVGFFVAGLLVPLAIETWGIFFGGHSEKDKPKLTMLLSPALWCLSAATSCVSTYSKPACSSTPGKPARTDNPDARPPNGSPGVHRLTNHDHATPESLPLQIPEPMPRLPERGVHPDPQRST